MVNFSDVTHRNKCIRYRGGHKTESSSSISESSSGGNNYIKCSINALHFVFLFSDQRMRIGSFSSYFRWRFTLGGRSDNVELQDSRSSSNVYGSTSSIRL